MVTAQPNAAISPDTLSIISNVVAWLGLCQQIPQSERYCSHCLAISVPTHSQHEWPVGILCTYHSHSRRSNVQLIDLSYGADLSPATRADGRAGLGSHVSRELSPRNPNNLRDVGSRLTGSCREALRLVGLPESSGRLLPPRSVWPEVGWQPGSAPSPHRVATHLVNAARL